MFLVLCLYNFIHYMMKEPQAQPSWEWKLVVELFTNKPTSSPTWDMLAIGVPFVLFISCLIIGAFLWSKRKESSWQAVTNIQFGGFISNQYNNCSIVNGTLVSLAVIIAVYYIYTTPSNK